MDALTPMIPAVRCKPFDDPAWSIPDALLVAPVFLHRSHGASHRWAPSAPERPIAVSATLRHGPGTRTAAPWHGRRAHQHAIICAIL